MGSAVQTAAYLRMTRVCGGDPWPLTAKRFPLTPLRDRRIRARYHSRQETMSGVDAFVWVTSWQQQCCGADFGVGSSVRWQVRTSGGTDEWIELLLGPEWATTIRFAEDHHLDQADGVLTGTVSEINVVSCERVPGEAPKPRPTGKVMVPVPGSGRLRRVETAAPWEPTDAGWSFDGWIVKLDAAHYEPGIESAVEDGGGAQASS